MVAIERDGVGVQLFAPEGVFEFAANALGLLVQLGGAVGFSECRGHDGGGAASGVDVALHFAERDGPARERAIGVEDGVLGILPTLMDESGAGLTVVFD